MKRITMLMMTGAALALAPSAAMAAVSYNDTPAAGWYFGHSTDYSPANTAVLSADSDELFLRWHERYPQSLGAPASVGDVYSFALGTQAPSFDFGFTSSAGFSGVTALLTVTNIGTGASASFDPLTFLSDNVTSGNSKENSENLSFDFLSAVGFNSNVNDTYRVTLDVNGLASGSQSLSVDAKIGAGAAAVPEPASWALMLGGFGLVGGAMRRRRVEAKLA